MPCPYFEPLTPVVHVTHPNARLPLLDEYDGLCHADAAGLPPPPDARFRCCNHGYSRGVCERLPDDREMRSAMRYNVVAHTAAILEVLCVEELNHSPGRYFTLTYDVSACALHTAAIDPVTRAQVAAFCRSYLKRFAVPSPR